MGVFEDVATRRIGGCAILDGGMGTALGELGLSEQEAWSAAWMLDSERIQAAVMDAYLGFLRAGCDILTINTYSISAEMLRNQGSEQLAGLVTHEGLSWLTRDRSPDEAAEEAMRKNVELARKAVEKHRAEQGESCVTCLSQEGDELAPVLLVASMGCYATCLGAQTSNREDADDRQDLTRCSGYGTSQDVLEQYHLARLEIILSCGVQALAFETVPDLIEVKAICEVLRKANVAAKGIDVWVTCTCKDEEHIDHGENFADCVDILSSSEHVTAIGVNCTEPHLVPALLRTARQRTTKRLVCYPNSGEVYLNRPLKDNETVHWAKTDHMCGYSSFADAAAMWHENGATLIGGCCRVTAKDIAMLAEKFPRCPPPATSNTEASIELRAKRLKH